MICVSSVIIVLLSSVSPAYLKSFSGGFLLAGIAVVCSPDVLDVHTVSLATMMAGNIGHFFFFTGLTGEAYFDRYGEHNTSLYLSSGVGT